LKSRFGGCDLYYFGVCRKFMLGIDEIAFVMNLFHIQSTASNIGDVMVYMPQKYFY